MKQITKRPTIIEDRILSITLDNSSGGIELSLLSPALGLRSGFSGLTLLLVL